MVFTARKILIVLIAVITAAFFSACGKESVSADTTAFVLNKDGTVNQTIVEENTESISQNELTAYINALVSAYTSETDDDSAVELKSCRAENSRVTVELEYASIADYAAFNKVPAFEGDLLSAVQNGYNFGTGFKTESGLSYAGYTLPVEYPGFQVLVLQEPMNVIVPEGALLISDDIKKNEDGSYTIPGSEVSGIPEIFNTINQQPSYLVFGTSSR